MCKRRYLVAVYLTLVVYTLSACAPAGVQVVTIPTLAVLPSATPTHTPPPTFTHTPSASHTPRPTETPTANLLETQVADLNATNAASQRTLQALQTQSAPTSPPAVSLTPSATITSTLPPSDTPPSVVAMQPQPIYALSPANLRTCAHRDCQQIARLQPGEAVIADGTILGEAIDTVHGSWFRVAHQGRTLYVYSQLVSFNPPAPPTSLPVYVPPPVEVAPISLPPASSGCPSLSATCSQLTCEQAYACLAAGNGGLDRDNDGIPCESVCLGS